MTALLLPRPSLPTQARTLHIPRPIKIAKVDPFVSNRLELRSYLGQTVVLHASVDSHSIRETRSFVCLTRVEYGMGSEIVKPKVDRELHSLDHAWCETTDHQLIPPEGVDVTCIAKVISYRRRDGSQSYGFFILDSITDTALMGITGNQCQRLYFSGDYPGSFIAAVQKEFQHLLADIQSGICKRDNVHVNYGPQGARSLANVIRKIERRVMHYLRKGLDAKALDIFAKMQRGLNHLNDLYEENPVF